MPSQQAYQMVLKDTINKLVVEQQLSTQTILSDVFEQLMLSEREVFLAESESNKGNGFYHRFVNHFQGRFEIKVPRDRQGLFAPMTLEVLKQDNERMNHLALSLYSQGISHRGVSQVFKDFFASQMSPGKLSQLVKAFEPKRLAWQQRLLESHYHVLLIDAIHHAVRRGTVAQEATYVVMGLKQDCTREIIGLYHLPSESAEGWKQVFDDLSSRGLKQTGLVICDELSGIEAAIKQHLPHTGLQFCMVHKIRTLLANIRHGDKAHLLADWQQVLNIDEPGHTLEDFQQRLCLFIETWAKRYPSIRKQLPENRWHHYGQYLQYPVQIRRMLYTTNWIERFNKEIRKITQHVNSFPNPDAALNLIFMVTKQMQEKTYRHPVTSFFPFKQQLNLILHGEKQTQSY